MDTLNEPGEAFQPNMHLVAHPVGCALITAITMMMVIAGLTFEEVLAAGEVRTPDLGGTATTRQLGEAIRTRLRSISA